VICIGTNHIWNSYRLFVILTDHFFAFSSRLQSEMHQVGYVRLSHHILMHVGSIATPLRNNFKNGWILDLHGHVPHLQKFIILLTFCLIIIEELLILSVHDTKYLASF